MADIRVFIGSSTEALPIAKALKTNLGKAYDVHLWNQDIFNLTDVTIESLIAETRLADFAVMILTRDDLLMTRKKKMMAPRDNIIFELGLFMGSIGKGRTIMLHSDAYLPKLPTDLAGIVTARYQEPARRAKISKFRGWRSTLESPANEMIECFKKLGRFKGIRYSEARQVQHRFKEGSPKFCKFFEVWYSQEGELRIYCEDLNWLKGKRMRHVVSTLRRKRRKLRIYLRRPKTDRIAQILLANGARLYKIKNSVKMVHRMSILDYDGLQRLIIRHVERDVNDIVFAETDSHKNSYLVGMAIDMVEHCHD